MQAIIKTIEDLSLNAWPSHQIQIYDGWLLRFSYFYTHRTNSVEQIGPSSIEIPKKIAYCEDIYKRWGTPAIFKISPLIEPEFDTFLENRGYLTEHVTNVMTKALPPLPSDSFDGFDSSDSSGFPDFSGCPAPGKERRIPVETSAIIPASWIDALFALKGTTNVMHRQVVPSMYRAIPKETICACIHDGGHIVATGLGILDRDFVGVYAIHVHPDYRRRHYASAICKTILKKGCQMGAQQAYLQVVADNPSAIRLYESLGFSYLYKYWFRCKRV